MTRAESIKHTPPHGGSGELDFTVYRSLEETEALWRAFERTALGTAFQCFDWVSSWYETVGRGKGFEPLIAVVKTGGGRIVALLPLALYRVGPVRLLTWLADYHANYHFALFDEAFLSALDGDAFASFWEALTRHLPAYDLIELECQPVSWKGYANPFVKLGGLPAIGGCPVATLDGGWQAILMERLNGKARGKLKRKERLLAKEGELAFTTTSGRDAQNDLERMLDQRRERLLGLGVADGDDPQAEAFYNRALGGEAERGILSWEVPALTLDGALIASAFCLVHDRRMHVLLLSMTQGPQGRHSPGVVLMARVIEDACARGLKSVDFGLGDGGHKSLWCDTEVALRQTWRGHTMRGHLFAVFLTRKYRLKKWIKTSPRIWAFARRLRARLSGA